MPFLTCHEDNVQVIEEIKQMHSTYKSNNKKELEEENLICSCFSSLRHVCMFVLGRFVMRRTCCCFEWICKSNPYRSETQPRRRPINSPTRVGYKIMYAMRRRTIGAPLLSIDYKQYTRCAILFAQCYRKNAPFRVR